MQKNLTKKLLPFAVVSSLAIGGLTGTFTADAKESPKQNNTKIKNVIFMIVMVWASHILLHTGT